MTGSVLVVQGKSCECVIIHFFYHVTFKVLSAVIWNGDIAGDTIALTSVAIGVAIGVAISVAISVIVVATIVVIRISKAAFDPTLLSLLILAKTSLKPSLIWSQSVLIKLVIAHVIPLIVHPQCSFDLLPSAQGLSIANIINFLRNICINQSIELISSQPWCSAGHHFRFWSINCFLNFILECDTSYVLSCIQK